MQTFDSSSKFLEALFHMISAIMFPVALGMSLPLFMYLAVLEKHSRVKSIMQMHGLRETNYWIANILLNLGLFLAIYATFHFFGAYVFKMSAFTGTSSIILVHCFLDSACIEFLLGSQPNRYGHYSPAFHYITQNSEFTGICRSLNSLILVHLHEPDAVHTAIRSAEDLVLVSPDVIFESVSVYLEAVYGDRVFPLLLTIHWRSSCSFAVLCGYLYPVCRFGYRPKCSA